MPSRTSPSSSSRTRCVCFAKKHTSFNSTLPSMPVQIAANPQPTGPNPWYEEGVSTLFPSILSDFSRFGLELQCRLPPADPKKIRDSTDPKFYQGSFIVNANVPWCTCDVFAAGIPELEQIINTPNPTKVNNTSTAAATQVHADSVIDSLRYCMVLMFLHDRMFLDSAGVDSFCFPLCHRTCSCSMERPDPLIGRTG
jgi:hypothetical protein